MRKLFSVLAAASAAAAVYMVPGTANADTGKIAELPWGQCLTDTNWTNWAGAICHTDKEYRVKVTYCRVHCSSDYGPWRHWDQVSDLTFNYPPGGSVASVEPELR